MPPGSRTEIEWSAAGARSAWVARNVAAFGRSPAGSDKNCPTKDKPPIMYVIGGSPRLPCARGTDVHPRRWLCHRAMIYVNGFLASLHNATLTAARCRRVNKRKTEGRHPIHEPNPRMDNMPHLFAACKGWFGDQTLA